MWPNLYLIEPKEFAEMAYAFMTGLPAFGSSGFSMMGPDELKRQRITYAKFWMGHLKRDLETIRANARKK